MFLLGNSPSLSIAFGVLGFGLCGFVLQHLAEGRKFAEQTAPRKRAIVALALAQWPYLYLAGAGAWHLAAS
jgi:hypothetical protein